MNADASGRFKVQKQTSRKRPRWVTGLSEEAWLTVRWQWFGVVGRGRCIFGASPQKRSCGEVETAGDDTAPARRVEALIQLVVRQLVRAGRRHGVLAIKRPLVDVIVMIGSEGEEADVEEIKARWAQNRNVAAAWRYESRTSDLCRVSWDAADRPPTVLLTLHVAQCRTAMFVTLWWGRGATGSSVQLTGLGPQVSAFWHLPRNVSLTKVHLGVSVSHSLTWVVDCSYCDFAAFV